MADQDPGYALAPELVVSNGKRGRDVDDRLAARGYNDRMTDRQCIKIVVEQHDDGFVAYPIGVDGIIVGEGDTYDEAVADVTSAIAEFIEEFGLEALGVDSPLLNARITEVQIAS